MLEIYQQLFKELKKTQISCYVYKGLDHLPQDLDGERGDLDIIVNRADFPEFKEVLFRVGFMMVRTRNAPYYFFSRDPATGRFVMVDAETSLRFGRKPRRAFRLNSDWTRIQMDEQLSVPVIAEPDYIPLMLMMRLTSASPKPADFEEIKNSLSTHGVEFFRDSYLGSLADSINSKGGVSLLEAATFATGWKKLQDAYRTKLLRMIAGGALPCEWLKWKERTGSLILRWKARLRHLFKLPPNVVRKRGWILAFIGVDGSGKSSLVDSILEDYYFKTTGVRRVYFGSNEYWIPGVLRLHGFLHRLLRPIPVIRGIPGLLLNLDRQLRVLFALYYRFQGKIVLCDRYYHDDEIGRRIQEKKQVQPSEKTMFSRLKQFLIDITRVRMLVQPDLTFFLDVSPDVAYERKQDYPFETMLEVNKEYKEYMKTRDKTVIINADLSQSEVRRQVIAHIMNLEKGNVR